MDSFPNLLSFISDLPNDSLSPVDRRWKLKNFRGFFSIMDEYKQILDPRVIKEDKDKSSNYIYVEPYYTPLAAKKPLDPEFSGTINFDLFPSEYYFVIEEYQDEFRIYRYEEEYMTIYAGHHWNNLTGLLYTLFHKENTTSDTFKELALKYKYQADLEYDWDSLRSNLEDPEIVLRVFKIFFDSLFKDLRRYTVRYMIFHKDEIIRRGGIIQVFPLSEDLFSAEMISSINDLMMKYLNYELQDEIIYDSQIPTVKENIILTDDRPSLDQDPEFVVDPQLNLGGGIACFKVLKDTISDGSRMKPSNTPYHDSALYDPPITRGVTQAQQPYRFQIVNSDIDYDDLDKDSSNMRKVVTADMLTRTLDWAAKKGLPLPDYGTEFYIHLGDSAPESLSKIGLLVAVYSRKRKDAHFLHPFPDYSYQIFSSQSRFDIVGSASMTWEGTRDLILKDSPQEPIKSRIRNIFFRGGDFTHTKIRRDLNNIQERGLTIQGNNIIKRNTLKIELCGYAKSVERMTIADMGNYQILLDLPGYGMWSNRLKFIALTGSYIARIIYLEHRWSKAESRWTTAEYPGDIWETFTDSFLPVEFTHTIIGHRYYGTFPKGDPMIKRMLEMNNDSFIQIVKELNDINNKAWTPAYQKRANKIRDRTKGLNDEHILRYIYALMMRQAAYYGFLK